MTKALKQHATYADLYSVPVLVPDLAAWRREGLPAVETGEYPAIAPDWICEVLSPSTERIDRAKKLGIYAREAVRHAWLVDPLQQTLEVLRLESGRWSLLATHSAGERMRSEPFEAIELDLGHPVGGLAH